MNTDWFFVLSVSCCLLINCIYMFIVAIVTILSYFISGANPKWIFLCNWNGFGCILECFSEITLLIPGKSFFSKRGVHELHTCCHVNSVSISNSIPDI